MASSRLALLLVAAGAGGFASLAAADPRIEHFVVLYMENRAADHFFVSAASPMACPSSLLPICAAGHPAPQLPQPCASDGLSAVCIAPHRQGCMDLPGFDSGAPRQSVQ